MEHRVEVSVIVATKDRPKKLLGCLRSILRQTFTRYEIIVVDNSPTASAKKWVERLQKRYPNRIKYVQFKVAATPAEVRNYGLNFISPETKYIKWIDDDDLLENKYALEDLVTAVSGDSGVIMVYGVCRYINSQGEVIKYSSLKPISAAKILITGSFPCSSVLYKREIFDHYGVPGMPTFLQSSEDLYLVLQAMEIARRYKKKIRFVPKLISVRRRNIQGAFYKNYLAGVKEEAMRKIRKRFWGLVLPHWFNETGGYLVLEWCWRMRKSLFRLLDKIGFTTEHMFIKWQFYFQPKITLV